jgi:phosphate uptake regulator
VARDLRVILAARDIAAVASLCLGLGQTLATGVGPAKSVISPDIRALIDRMGSESAALLRQANGAWETLDEAEAQAVFVGVGESRPAQRDFFTALVKLEGVPVEAAVALGTAVRAYSRLTDHAAEMAESVIFAVTGQPPGHAPVEALIRP